MLMSLLTGRKGWSVSSLLLLTYLFGLPETVAQQDTVSFIFIGHCYQDGAGGTKVDYRLESFDFSSFQGVWLGGDVCSEAMLDYSTVQYIDSLFDLGNPDTHWSLGNHDARNGNWEWYEEFSGRKTWHAYSSFGITRFVLNTNLVPTDCESLNDQYDKLTTTIDTVSSGNRLILIMHHGIWRDVPGLPAPPVYAQSDLTFWNANCYAMGNTFNESIYPHLVNAKQRGVEVFCVLGDMGAGPKSIDFLSDDGIHFLGCGFDHNEPEDEVLIFKLDKESNVLTYQYYLINDLLSSQVTSP